VEPLLPPSAVIANRSTEPPPPPLIPRTPPDIRDDPACKLFHWPLSALQAAEILKRTATFAGTGIYNTGESPPQIAAYNVLLDHPDAVTWFEDIGRTGGMVGRLYALCAFQVIDAQRAQRLSSDLRGTQSEVFTQFGCSGMNENVDHLVDVIEKNGYGKFFRESREETYRYYSQQTNICTRPKRQAASQPEHPSGATG